MRRQPKQTEKPTVLQLLREHRIVSHAELMAATGDPFDVVLFDLDKLDAQGSEDGWRLPEPGRKVPAP